LGINFSDLEVGKYRSLREVGESCYSPLLY